MAQARPMPDAAPVTSATRPVKGAGAGSACTAGPYSTANASASVTGA